MKRFAFSEINEALEYAREGGQALHVFQWVETARMPGCFRRDIRAGKSIAHLFDQDIERLRMTARKLGVRVILVEHRGRKGQHVDLCGKPLERAIAGCAT